MIFHLSNSELLGEIDYDDIDLLENYKWNLRTDGYIGTNVWHKNNTRNKAIKLHKLIGERIGLKTVSFKDKNKLNCRRENLQEYINKGNCKAGKLKQKYISEITYRGKIRFTINKWDGKKLVYYGMCDTLEDAIKKKQELGF